jgi:hypothetical protein
MGNLIDQVLNLKILEGNRTTAVGAAIAILGVYQAVSPHPMPNATYVAINGILTERLASFAKKHKEK